MIKKITAIMIVASLSYFAILPTAFAGTVVTRNVDIYDNSTTIRVRGLFKTAADSADNQQYLGCYSQANSWGTQNGGCEGRNSAGRRVRCWTSNEELLKVIGTVSDGTYMTFYADQDTGECTTIRVYNHSYGR